jgi:hypothetical protein
MATKTCRKCGSEFDADQDWKTICIDCWHERKAAKFRVDSLESMVKYWEGMARKNPDVARILELEEALKAKDKEVLEWRYKYEMASFMGTGTHSHTGSSLPGDWQKQLPRLIQLCHPDKHGNSTASTELTQWLLKLRKRK